jgi:hypothetical protein
MHEFNSCSHPHNKYFLAHEDTSLLPKKSSIRTTGLPTEFFTLTIIEDLLSPFCMFDTEG